MPAEIEYVKQKSPEWLALRRGVITGSQASRLSSPAKRKTLAKELLYEQISKSLAEGVQVDAMARGNELEENAIARYELENSVSVEEIGFAWHADYVGLVGCSPDRFNPESNAVLEIKCPSSKKVIDYLLDGPDMNALWQIHFNAWVLDANYGIFISYFPELESPYDYQQILVDLDRRIVDNITTGVEDTLDLIETYRGKMNEICY